MSETEERHPFAAPTYPETQVQDLVKENARLTLKVKELEREIDRLGRQIELMEREKWVLHDH